MLRALAAAAAALLTLIPAALLAHHGWSGYDASQVLMLTGIVREAGYEHPHGFVKLEAKDKTWLVVLAPPSRMENREGRERFRSRRSPRAVLSFALSRIAPHSL
jgi:hypothetical protein